MRKTKIKIILDIFVVVALLIFSTILVNAEVPMLEKEVSEGTLPPMEDRLPEEPNIVEPVEKIGDYGGSWNLFITSDRDEELILYMDTGLLSWNREQDAPEPDVAKDWEVNEDGTVFTFYLREDMKWSDGEPFTTEDIEFWYEDMLNNDELMPSKPSWLNHGGELMEINIIDDYTFECKFEKTYGLFLEQIARASTLSNDAFFAPKHYLKQFHPDYTSEEKLDELMEEEGFDNWYELFGFKDPHWSAPNPERPHMTPWIPKTEPPAERYEYERNPYYYGTDPEGNQLPYIDEVVLEVADEEVQKMRTVAGKSDFSVSRAISFQDYTLLKENEDEGGYEVVLWDHLTISQPGLEINQNYLPDDFIRELFQETDFRRAFSVALNRSRMNEMLYNGFAKEWQASLSPISPYFKEEYAEAYTEYDPDKANQLLDEIGLDEKDGQGYRLRPDGERLNIMINVPSGWPQIMDVLELVKEDLKEVGINCDYKALHPSLFNTRKLASELQITAWPFAKSMLETDLVPTDAGNDWSPLWGRWYQSGRKVTSETIEEEVEGEEIKKEVEASEPPPKIIELMDTWDEIQVTIDEEKRAELYDEILKTQAEELWVIGTVGNLPKALPKKPYFRNVPTDRSTTWSYHHGHFIGQTDPEQYFIEKDHQ